MPADIEAHGGLQLLLPRQREAEQALTGLVVLDLAVVEIGADDRARIRASCRRADERGGALVDLEGPVGGGLPREQPRLLEGAGLEPGPQVAVVRTRVRAAAQSCGSCPSTSRPLRPSRTTVVRPPTAAATTGVPVACASAATSPNDSLYDGTATAVAAAYQRASSAWVTGGTNRTMSAMPRSTARSASACGFSRPVPEGPPTIGTTSEDRRSGDAREHLGDRVQQHVRGLERLDPAGEQQHVGVDRQPQAGAGLGGGERAEDVEVDAGVDHLDPARLGVVQLDQLLGLDVGVGDEHVGGLDHLLLADHPGDRLGGVAVGERGVLDLGHRVHRVDQRDAPAVARQRADLAGEPVVGVDGVVVAERLGGLRAQHLAGEHAELGGQLLLGEALERPGVDVPHR